MAGCRKWSNQDEFFEIVLVVQRNLLDLLDDFCVNSIRLRVWVNPACGCCGKQDVFNVAKRAAAKGYRLMIDFHYSDFWAYTGQQTKPAAWLVLILLNYAKPFTITRSMC